MSEDKISRRKLVQTTAISVGVLAAISGCSRRDETDQIKREQTFGLIDARLDALGNHPAKICTARGQICILPHCWRYGLYFRHWPCAPIEGAKLLGKLSKDLSVEEGAYAAERTALNIISQAKAACGGNLDKVKQWVRLTGYVNSSPDFTAQPQVMNGASELLVKVFWR